MNRARVLRMAPLGAIAVAMGACGPRLILGSETPDAGVGGLTETGGDLQTTGAGGSAVGVPVGSQDAGTAPAARAALGQHCAIDTDCASPQVCAQGRCHATCSPSVGCKLRNHLLPCVTTLAKVPVCPLPCDPAWGQDSSLCIRAGEADDGPPDLYTCPGFPSGSTCVASQADCGFSCSDGVNTLQQVCDQGVCNCSYKGQLACRCVTADPPSICGSCCEY